MEVAYFALPWRADRLPIHRYVHGELARVVHYERRNGRCPSIEFLENQIVEKMLKRFKGQFQVLCEVGSAFHNGQRFKALQKKGKPLWEFKESDHRLYCARLVKGSHIIVVLFNGWVKDKNGRTEREDREIIKALDLFEE